MANDVRDWRLDWGPAEYDGALFFVDHVDRPTGRRLIVHQFPLRDDPYIEDLGQDEININVTGYVASDDADGEADALQDRCGRGGAKSLSLPFWSGRAHCKSCKRDDKHDKQGYIAFSLHFVKQGSAAAPLPLAYLAELVYAVSASIETPLVSLVAQLFNGVSVPAYVRRDAAQTIVDAALALNVAATTATLDATAAPAIIQATQHMAAQAESLAAIGPRTGSIGNRAYLANTVSDSPPPVIVSMIGAIVDSLATAAGSDAAEVLQPLADFVPSSPGWTGRSHWARVREQNANLIALVVRATALGRYAAAVADTVYVDRPTAIAARASLTGLFQPTIELATESGAVDLLKTLLDAQGKASELISRSILDLSSVNFISAPTSMPALWWANRMYGTAGVASDRTREIVSRNGIWHPSFMPTQFEALAV